MALLKGLRTWQRPKTSLQWTALPPPLVRDYWGYTPDRKSGTRGAFRLLAPAENTLELTVFPFLHQPSARKVFNAERTDEYVAFQARTRV